MFAPAWNRPDADILLLRSNDDRTSCNCVAGVMRSFIDQKLFHININVVSSGTLRSAQKNPEEYGDLTVKVSGYNAFFTELSKDIQDSIIARTAHGL